MGNCNCSAIRAPPTVVPDGADGSGPSPIGKRLDACHDDLSDGSTSGGFQEECSDDGDPHFSEPALTRRWRNSKVTGVTLLPEQRSDSSSRLLDEEEGRQRSDSDVDDIVELDEKQLAKKRRALCAEPWEKGFYKERYWNKHAAREELLLQAFRRCRVFGHLSEDQVKALVGATEIHKRSEEWIVEQGKPVDGLFVVLEGAVAAYACSPDAAGDVGRISSGGSSSSSSSSSSSAAHARYTAGDVIDEAAVLWGLTRPFSLYADGEVSYGKLRREEYMNLYIRDEFHKREQRQQLLRNTKLLEMMDDEGIAKLADILKTRSYEEGSKIVTQGDSGEVLFILKSGECRCSKTTVDDEQECMRYKPGDLFGELALIKRAPRAATVTAITRVEVLTLTRRQFERLFSPMAQLQQQQYLTDPRKLIADFYDRSDGRGPRGSLRLKNLEPDPERFGESTWFAVYRPTSREAIAKMLSTVAVGKGLNVKGKSAKQGILSGYVPFVQICDNQHKDLIEHSPAHSRILIYYKNKALREEARKALQIVLEDCQSKQPPLKGLEGGASIRVDEAYEPGVFGLEIPEALLREAYIMRPDLSPVMGWETGRRSEPAFMDMNLHAIRDATEPKVVLYQHDESDAMNPRGLLVAYAEKYVKPVVSDFDTFLVGSRGMEYEPLPQNQVDLVLWSLYKTWNILDSLDHSGWTSRWINVLKEASKEGEVTLPKFGFGDPTSYQLISDVVSETSPCGAVRHGAECCNFYFPQELDDEYLVVWHGFPEKPWEYKSEGELREFLKDRVQEGYSFPLNPVWPVRDLGWYDVLQALRASEAARKCLASWYPERKIFELIDECHSKHPNGFRILGPGETPQVSSSKSLHRAKSKELAIRFLEPSKEQSAKGKLKRGLTVKFSQWAMR